MSNYNMSSSSDPRNVSEMEELYVSNNRRSLLRSTLRRDENLLRFNTLMSELDEIDLNLEILKAGHEQLREGTSRLFAATAAAAAVPSTSTAPDIPAPPEREISKKLSLHRTPSLASIRIESIKNHEEEKEKKRALDKSKPAEIPISGFVLPAALKERDKERESTEEEQQKKSEFVTNLLMLSLFPPSKESEF